MVEEWSSPTQRVPLLPTLGNLAESNAVNRCVKISTVFYFLFSCVFGMQGNGEE